MRGPSGWYSLGIAEAWLLVSTLHQWLSWQRPLPRMGAIHSRTFLSFSNPVRPLAEGYTIDRRAPGLCAADASFPGLVQAPVQRMAEADGLGEAP